jgi:hypothetical protein
MDILALVKYDRTAPTVPSKVAAVGGETCASVYRKMNLRVYVERESIRSLRKEDY